MPTKKTLFMETTEVPAERTACEIIAALVAAGATQINTEYEAGSIKGLRWIMRVSGRDVVFAMPARIEPVFLILRKRAAGGAQWYGTEEQIRRVRDKATRVAWRQLLRWVLAQLAMVECGMAETSEVFFPYIDTGHGQTLFEVFKERGFKALPAPEGPTQ